MGKIYEIMIYCLFLYSMMLLNKYFMLFKEIISLCVIFFFGIIIFIYFFLKFLYKEFFKNILKFVKFLDILWFDNVLNNLLKEVYRWKIVGD